MHASLYRLRPDDDFRSGIRARNHEAAGSGAGSYSGWSGDAHYCRNDVVRFLTGYPRHSHQKMHAERMHSRRLHCPRPYRCLQRIRLRLLQYRIVPWLPYRLQMLRHGWPLPYKNRCQHPHQRPGSCRKLPPVHCNRSKNGWSPGNCAFHSCFRMNAVRSSLHNARAHPSEERRNHSPPAPSPGRRSRSAPHINGWRDTDPASPLKSAGFQTAARYHSRDCSKRGPPCPPAYGRSASESHGPEPWPQHSDRSEYSAEPHLSRCEFCPRY